MPLVREKREMTGLGQPGGWSATLVYGVAHLGKSLFWYAGEILFAFYLTELVGLTASQMGIVIAAGLIVSAALDLSVGARFQHTLASAATAGRLQLVGAVACGVALPAVFLGFWMPEDLRFAYALATSLGFRLAYALYDIPQNSLMTLATNTPAARNRVASTRIWFSGLATIAISLAVGPLIASAAPGDAAGRYMILAGCVALPAILGAAALARMVAADPPAPARADAETPAPSPNRSVTASISVMMALMFVTSLGTPVFSKLEPYFASFVLRSSLWGGVIITAMALGITIGQPLWAWASRRLSHAAILAWAAALQIAALLAFALSGHAPLVLGVCALAFGVGNGGVGMIVWAAFSETVSRRARDRTGAAYAAFTATGKFALGLGGLGLGAILGGFDFRDAAGGEIAFWMTAAPAAAAVACLGLAALWPRSSRRR